MTVLDQALAKLEPDFIIVLGNLARRHVLREEEAAALRAEVVRLQRELEEAQSKCRAAEEWAKTMEHERDYEQDVVSVDLQRRLDDEQAESVRLRKTLEQIADPSYVGNYGNLEVVAIYREWARAALGVSEGAAQGARSTDVETRGERRS